METGAECTFLCVETIAAVADHEQPEQELCGITGHCTQLKGPVLATVAVAGEDRTLPIYVVNIEENLLGLDYIQESKAVLNFGDMTMEIRDRKELLLEENSEASLCCCLCKKMGREGLLSAPPQALLDGIVIGRTLVVPGMEEACVLVANPFTELCQLLEGVLMGICEEVQWERCVEVVPKVPWISDTEVPTHQ
ncbi:hypothetical protein E2C01_045171 [Portunus trituberculatus]|uniref:Uncharacterized protein n=1 Tax=Portunus trituberculatus TaxID=210409 RepID=A0A5B7G132_PORTR|nr:hypothetical protein [Portunus trituberculatus]